MFKFENGAILALSEEEEAAVMAAYEDYQKQKNKQPMSQNEVVMLLTQQLINTVNIDDQTSLRMKTYYPIFDETQRKRVKKIELSRRGLRFITRENCGKLGRKR